MKHFSSLVLILLLGQAQADIKGRVLLADGRPAANAVITLEAPGLKSKPLAHAMIDQRDKTFLPHVLAVPVGTTVDFPNNDLVFHNVFAEFEAKRFDLGMYPKGTKKRQTFTRAGVVALFCSVHSDMSAYVYVTETPYYAVADSRGRFELKGAPEGSYALKVWHESGQSWKQPLAVSSENKALELKLRRG